MWEVKHSNLISSCSAKDICKQNSTIKFKEFQEADRLGIGRGEV